MIYISTPIKSPDDVEIQRIRADLQENVAAVFVRAPRSDSAMANWT